MAKKESAASTISNEEAAPLAIRPPEPSVAQLLQGIIEKGVTPENMSVMEAMVGLYERMDAKNAEREFNKAFVALQTEIPKIVATKPVPNKDGSIRFMFAPLEEIDAQLRPIALKHGFTWSFEEGQSDAARLEKICTVYHTAGHKRSNRYACLRSAPPGASPTQGDGSTHSYAKRGALCDAFSIVVKGQDDDARLLGERIDEATAEDLKQRVKAVVKSVGANEKAFLKYAGATGEDYTTIPTAKLPQAMEILLAKEKEAAAQKKATPKDAPSKEQPDPVTGEYLI